MLLLGTGVTCKSGPSLLTPTAYMTAHAQQHAACSRAVRGVTADSGQAQTICIPVQHACMTHDSTYNSKQESGKRLLLGIGIPIQNIQQAAAQHWLA
jgi:hypothetical protein